MANCSVWRQLFAALVLVAPPAGGPSQQAGKLPDAPVFSERGAVVRLFAPNIWIDFHPRGRRVVVRAEVCLRAGVLEEFMCLRGTKEHESILAADISAIMFHAALLASGAEPGHPAQFDEKSGFKPPTGQPLQILVEWKAKEGYERLSAKEWVRHVKSKKPMSADWVFAGSQWIVNPLTKQKYYLGSDGDVISVANFAGSIIDVAMRSSSANETLLFEANTERIPPVGTEVFVIISPREKQPRAVEPEKASQPASKRQGA